MLVKDLFEMAKQKKSKQAINNYVAKNMPTTGAGRHKDKKGEKASRQTQKKEWKKEAGL